MKYKILILLLVVVLAFGMTGCGDEEESTTMTGIVVSVEGTKVTLQEFDSQMQGGFNGEKPEGFDPENFGGKMPEGFDPENFDGEMPEGFDPENFDGEMPEGAEIPEGGMPGFGGQISEGESVTVDLADAHISVEIDGGKATGSMEDITSGTFITITMDEDGKATDVLVSSMSGMGRGNKSN